MKVIAPQPQLFAGILSIAVTAEGNDKRAGWRAVLRKLMVSVSTSVRVGMS